MVDFVVPRALDIGEIPGIVAEFAGAARHALEAGFDGVELHAASGYLIQQFLDAAANTRTDGYGGSPENRARLLLETIDAMADAVGAGRVGIKLSPQMPFNGNAEPDAEAIYPIVVRELSKRGLAYLHVGRYVAHDWHAALRPLFNGPFLAGSGFDGAKGKPFCKQVAPTPSSTANISSPSRTCRKPCATTRRCLSPTPPPITPAARKATPTTPPSPDHPRARDSSSKSFLLLFSKKEGLAFTSLGHS